MDLSSPVQQQLNTRLAENQVKSEFQNLEHKLKTHENREDLRKTARQFEGVFFKQLLDQMDKTIDRSSGFMSGGSGEDNFRGMLYDKISESIATRSGGSGFGIADAIYRQMEAKLPKVKDDSNAAPPSTQKEPLE